MTTHAPCSCGPAPAGEAASPDGRCPRCGGQVCAPAAGADLGDGAAPARNLGHEGHLRAIATIHRLGALLPSLSGCVMLLAAVKEATTVPTGTVAGGAAIAGLALVLLLGGLASFAANHRLARYDGRARWPVIGLTCLGLPLPLLQQEPSVQGIGLALGLAWTGAVAWAVGSAEAARICSPPYRAAVERDAATRVAFWRSPFLVVPLALGVLGCCCATPLSLLGARTR